MDEQKECVELNINVVTVELFRARHRSNYVYVK